MSGMNAIGGMNDVSGAGLRECMTGSTIPMVNCVSEKRTGGWRIYKDNDDQLGPTPLTNSIGKELN